MAVSVRREAESKERKNSADAEARKVFDKGNIVDELYEELERVTVEKLTKVLNNLSIARPKKKMYVNFTSELVADDREYTRIERDGLQFWLTFRTLESLEDLWKKSRSGYLTATFREEFLTQEFVSKFGLKVIFVPVTVDETAYQMCKTRLLSKGNYDCVRK